MSVWVHKDGKSELINPLSLGSAMASGWSIKKEGVNRELQGESQENEKPSEDKDEKANEKAGETLEDLREQAKAKKIRGWHLMGEDKLKEALSDAD